MQLKFLILIFFYFYHMNKSINNESYNIDPPEIRCIVIIFSYLLTTWLQFRVQSTFKNILNY